MKPHCRTIPTLFAAAALSIFPACKREDATKTPPPPPSVLVVAAATRDVPVYREWVGTLDGSENADIRARVTGHLMKRVYEEGSLVKKGDVLFLIDPRPFESALAQAKSELEEGKAAQIASEAEAERSKNLFAQKAIAEREFTNKTQLNESSKAKVSALEAAVETARLNLEFCRITSPVEGIAGIAQAQVGDLVGSGANSILTQVSTLDPMKIVFPVSEADYLVSAKRAQETVNLPFDQRPARLEVILADGSTFPEKARLLSVDRQVKASTGTILVTAQLANPGNVLRPGFFARARIEADVLKDAVVVPQRAMSEVQGSYQIGVIGADGKAEIRPVQVGPRTGSDWVITSGLKAGEKVVVEGLQKIKSGMPVSAKPWVPPSEKAAAPAAEVKPAAAAVEAKPEAKPEAK